MRTNQTISGLILTSGIQSSALQLRSHMLGLHPKSLVSSPNGIIGNRQRDNILGIILGYILD